MISDQAREVAGPIVDGVAIIVRSTRAQLVAPLPEEVARHAILGPRSRLPRFLNRAVVVGDAI